MRDFETRQLSLIKKRKDKRARIIQNARRRQRKLLFVSLTAIVFIGAMGYGLMSRKTHNDQGINPSAIKTDAKPRQKTINPFRKKAAQLPEKRIRMRTFEDFNHTNEGLTPQHIEDVKALVIGEAQSELETLDQKITSPSLMEFPDVKESLEIQRDALLKKIKRYQSISPKDESTWHLLE